MEKMDAYFKQKTKNISFIEVKEGTYIDVNGYRVTEEIPLPIVVDDLLDEVQASDDGEEIKFVSFVNGIVYTLGVDPEFKYFKEYSKILYSYDKKIEDYILHKALENINGDLLELGMVWLRALSFINNKNLFARYSYALAIAERAKQAFQSNDRVLGKEFLDSSTTTLEEILDEDSNFYLALYKLGYHYKSRSEFKKSEITWKKFLRLAKEPELLDEVRDCIESMKDDVMYEKGYNLVLEGYSEEGLEKLLAIADKYDKWWNLFFMIGLGYRQVGKYEKAKEYFEKVLEIDEEQVDTLNELGLCMVYLDEAESAISNFSKAITLRADDYEILCNRGMTYLQLGDIKRAEEDISNAYDINPNDEITIACMNELDRYME